MQSIDLCRKTSGRLWHRKLTADSDNGCLLKISNSSPNVVFKQGRIVRFHHVAFDKTGDKFVGADHIGHLFLFDLHKNRFSLIEKIGIPCTSIAFDLHQPNEVLVALSDYSLRCYNTEAKELVSTMRGHSSAIHQISVHGSGRHCISSSHDISICWDLDTFTRKRTLNGAQVVGVQEVFFLPTSNTLVSCFKDDSVFAWDCDTMKCLYQLNSPMDSKPMYRCLATSQDSRTLIAAGRSQFLHVWNLDSQHLIRIIQLPSKIREVKRIQFVNDAISVDGTQILAVLAQDGILRFIDINTCKLLFETGSHSQRINRFVIGPNGRYAACVMDDGSIQVYSIEYLSGSTKRVPAPLVQDVEVSPRMRRKRKPKVAFETSDCRKPDMVGLSEQTKGENLHWKKEKEETIYRDIPEGLDMKRLLKILKGYGEYPEKYRLFIWRSILRLPENHVAFSVLVDKGTHNAYSSLHEVFPIKGRILLRSLQRVLSALAYWSPIFGEADFLPMLAFPFVKLFPNNQLICFEIIAVVITNWCQKWFEFFPNPPLTILGVVETLLSHNDRHLMQHFVSVNLTTQTYAWPMLQTLFSEILTKDDWLKLWDNIFSNHPSFCLFVIVAYLISSRQTLLSTTDIDDFKFFFHHRNAIDVNALIKETYRLYESTPDDIHPKRMISEFIPLTRGQYPIFDKYPKFVVDYLIQERERIRQDEQEYLRQKQMTLDFQKEAEKTRQEEEAFYRQQDLMIGAEQQRRAMIASEEKKLADQRSRLQAMKREVSLRELKLLDAVRRKFMTHQQKVKDVELQRLDDELERKISLRDQETKRALDDAEIKAMELEAQKRLFQQELMRDNAESSMRYRADRGIHDKRGEIEDTRVRTMVESSYAVDSKAMKNFQSELARIQQKSTDIELADEVAQRRIIGDIDRDIKALEIAKHHIENQNREDELYDMAKITVSKENDRLRNDITRFDNMKQSVATSTNKSPLQGSIFTRRDAFAEKQNELLSQINKLRSKLAQRGSQSSHNNTMVYREVQRSFKVVQVKSDHLVKAKAKQEY
eukprot:gene18697-20585_t